VAQALWVLQLDAHLAAVRPETDAIGQAMA
jgi:hypothetical protein